MNEKMASKQQIVEAEFISDYVHRVTAGNSTLYSSFHTLRKLERHIFEFMSNPDKNRFANIVLFNEGAVLLKAKDKDEGTYIHASRIKSKYGNYILAQAPLPNTVNDFYRMIWQYEVCVIVCLVPLDKPSDCTPYFDKKRSNKIKSRGFTMKTFAVRKEGNLDMYELRLKSADSKDGPERIVHVVHCKHWVLTRRMEARDLIRLIRATWALEQSMSSLIEMKEMTTLVHGSSGVRRTGTYVVTAMLCKQIREKGVVSIVTAVASVRRYRFGVLRNKSMFCTLLESVLNFSADEGLLDRSSPEFSQSIAAVREALIVHDAEEEDVHAAVATPNE